MTTSYPDPTPAIQVEDDRTGLSITTLRRALADNLFYIQGKSPSTATRNDYYMALAYTVRDRMLQRWLNTQEVHRLPQTRIVCYLSAEFLVGPHLGNNLINLGIYDRVREAVEASGLHLQTLLDQEEEPGLGNGGLGRLAACYLDSLSTLEIPAIGYGIRYEFGIFDQVIQDGWQVEITDKWLQYGNPWEIPRPEASVIVKLGGKTESYTDHRGHYRVRWLPNTIIKGVPYDTPILGYHVNTVNTLRLWRAEATESFDFHAFNLGDYYGAVQAKVVSENITKVLYPNDEALQGKQLRLEQQYFFVSCALQDMIRNYLEAGGDLQYFHQKYTVQLNDTHPAIGVAELMRLLLDDYGMDWDHAWYITRHTFAYTNHTLLPEALETWSIPLFGALLPRHLEIIFEINRRFLDEVRLHYWGGQQRLSECSLIDEQGDRSLRMAHLACVGSYAINGVAALHTELLKQDVLRDFYDLYPHKFSNKTNGVTPRRWLALSNPLLTQLISEKIGHLCELPLESNFAPHQPCTDWLRDLQQLKHLEAFATDPDFQTQWRTVKQTVKQQLAERIARVCQVTVDPQSLFDIQVKRIHEYKRQHLNVLHIITLYNRLRQNPHLDIVPRTFIFGGKAAPGYKMAKLMIKFINAVASVINHDRRIDDRIKVVFIPDYNVTNSQPVYPAADLSEQISTAGKEASGTGNMKFCLNGALTIGTLDGANVEIREEVGAENFFLFGLTAGEVATLKAQGYHPQAYYQNNAELREVLDLVAQGYFSSGDRERFKPLVDNLLDQDPYLLLADYQSYVDCQDQVNLAYQNQSDWVQKSILNTARSGKFSSDRAIAEYCRDIWKISAVPIELQPYVQANAELVLTDSPP